MKKYLLHISITLAITLLPCLLQADDPKPEPGTEQLEQVEKNRRKELLLDTSTDWSRFTKIKLDKATVEFRKNWARDQRNRTANRPTEKDMERVKSELSELLNDVFIGTVTKNGTYTMTDQTGEDIMLITPAIVDLNINAPDRMTAQMVHSFTDSNGSMTLLLEIKDSVSGAVLAKARDQRDDPHKGYLEWTTSGTNRRSAELLLIRWAKGVNEWLNTARSNSKP